MRIEQMSAGLQVDLSDRLTNAVSARMLSKAITQSAIEVGAMLEMLPQAGITEIGGLLDVSA